MGIFSYLGNMWTERSAKKQVEERARIDALKEKMKPQFTLTPLEKAQLAREEAMKKNCPPKPRIIDEDVSEAWDKFGKEHIKTVTREGTRYELENVCLTGGVSIEPDKSQKALSKAGLKVGMDVTACYDSKTIADGDFKAEVAGGGVAVKADLERNLTIVQKTGKTTVDIGEEGVDLGRDVKLFRADGKISSGVNKEGGFRIGGKGEIAVADAKLEAGADLTENPDCSTTYETAFGFDVTDKTKAKQGKTGPDLVDQHIDTQLSGKLRATPVERTSLSPEYGNDKPGEISPRTEHRIINDYNDMKRDPNCKDGMRKLNKDDIAAPVKSMMGQQGRTYNDALKETKDAICDEEGKTPTSPAPQVMKKPRVYEGMEL